ncbi:IPT/TIG domain protein [compost metagenome]
MSQQWKYLALGAAVALFGCQSTPSVPSSVPAQQPAAAVPPVIGQLQLPGYAPQALPAEVLSAATVTLIDPGTNNAVSTALTGPTGNFMLQFTGAFVPALNAVYVVEAYKGLSNNAPGYHTPRFRTLIKLTAGGWTSVSGTSIVINALTTAIAVESYLDSVNVPAGSTIGKVVPPATLVANAFAPHHPDAEVYQLAGDISSYLTNNMDPLLNVNAIKPTIGSFNPTAGSPGTIVTLYGTGFNPNPGSTTVTFNGVPADIIYVAPRVDVPGESRMAVVVPNNFTTGAIQVATPQGSATTGASFTTLVPVLNSLSVATGSVGTTVTLTGLNFDLNPNNDIVRFNGILAPVSTASATTLTCQVPLGATTGNVVVTTNAGVTFPKPFTVFPGITALDRNTAVIGGTVVITGTNFDGSSTLANTSASPSTSCRPCRASARCKRGPT